MRKLALAALVAFAPATSFAFGPMSDIRPQMRGVSTAPVVEVGGCNPHWAHCGKKNRRARNRVDIDQNNYADVDISSDYGCNSNWDHCGKRKRGARNRVDIDQNNYADVDIRSGKRSRNDVYIDQSNDANVNIR